jgi:hypothetical protein
MICHHCGKETPPKKISWGEPKKYCSTKCVNAAKWKRFRANPIKLAQRNRKIRETLKRRRSEFFDNKTCILCGTDNNLCIHHIDPEEKESHYIWFWSKERREKELAKCTVLCESCHNRLHHPKIMIHGTITMYKRHKCKCNECRSANARYEYARRRTTVWG